MGEVWEIWYQLWNQRLFHGYAIYETAVKGQYIVVLSEKVWHLSHRFNMQCLTSNWTDIIIDELATLLTWHIGSWDYMICQF